MGQKMSRKWKEENKCHVQKSEFVWLSCRARETWTIKKAKHQRIDAFEMWC